MNAVRAGATRHAVVDQSKEWSTAGTNRNRCAPGRPDTTSERSSPLRELPGEEGDHLFGEQLCVGVSDENVAGTLDRHE